MSQDKKPAQPRKKQVGKWPVYGVILAIFTVASFGLWIASGLISYPTDQHREVSAQLNEQTAKALTSGDFDKTLNSAEFKKLEATPENVYSGAASLVMTLVQIVAWVALIGVVYSYLRKRHIGKDQAMAVALLYGISAALIFPLTVLLSDIFYPSGMSTFPGLHSVLIVSVGLPFVFLFSALFAYILARIFQWRYNRKYNFAVE